MIPSSQKKRKEKKRKKYIETFFFSEEQKNSVLKNKIKVTVKGSIIIFSEKRKGI